MLYRDKKFMRVAGMVLAMALCFPQTVLAGEANEGNDPEINQIVAAAKRYVQSCHDSQPLPKVNLAKTFNYVFVKRVGECAMVDMVPKPQYKDKAEIHGIILKKIGGKWLGQTYGTDDVPMKEICPDLFK